MAGMIETHTSFPMLMLFRSQHRSQNWVTALGLLSDAALQCQLIRGAENCAPSWMLRRSIRLFRMLTEGDLSEDRAMLDETYAADSGHLWADPSAELEAHGFDLPAMDEARRHTLELRRQFDAPLEFLIEELTAPRGFWGHDVASEDEHAPLPTIRPDRSE